MNFLTTGEIAKKLNVDRDTVSYALRRARVKPIGRAGQVRIFTGTSLTAVKDFLEARASRKKRGKINEST